MKKILCPVDPSSASEQFIRYIGHLAKEIQSKIFLISTAASRKEPIIAGYHPDETSRLDDIHDYISGIMHVPCGIEPASLQDNKYKKLGLVADHYDLVTLPISNYDTDKVVSNGLDVIKVMQQTLAPMLLIPERFAFQKIDRLLYAYDYKHEPEPPLLQLSWLADWFNVELRFLTVFPGDISAPENTRMKNIQQKIKASWNEKHPISFESLIHPDITKCIEQYLDIRKDNDLLVLSINHHNMLELIWHKSVVKRFLHFAKHPYLILHK